MKVKELIEALQKLPQDLVVGSAGFFGELDQELDGVAVVTGYSSSGWRRGETLKFVELQGMSPSYPEPD